MSVSQASREAYDYKKPSIPDCQRTVLRCFISGEELCQAAVQKMLNIPINQVNPRINELVKLNYLEELQKRKKTNFSRIKLTHYKITDAGREKLQPKQTSMF